MNGNRKGGQFERQLCRQLSLWWTSGKRDDVFWRSSQSGGRATQRAKSGKSTFGAYGDIAAVDPVGLPFLRVFTLELKRGRSHGFLGDLIDLPKKAKQRPFESAMEQAMRSAQQAKSLSWLLICQRDRRKAMVYGDHSFLHPILGNAVKSRVRTRFGLWVTYLPLSFFFRLSPDVFHLDNKT